MPLPVKFYGDEFCGVILRNVPEKVRTEEIEGFLARKGLNGKVDSLNCLRGEFFCLLLMDSLDQCEQACIRLNDRVINAKALKAHIHPETCMKRGPGQVHEYLSCFFKEDED